MRPPHFELLQRELLETLQPGGWDVLIAQAPPRHGKSEFLSRWVPSWFHLVYPTQRSILTSYALDLARDHSREVRDRVHEYAPLFGHKGIDRKVSGNADWKIQDYGGGMKAAGIRGAITGRGADLFLIDDYFKNDEEAVNQTLRDKQWSWFQTTATTRFEPGCKLVVLACLVGDTPVAMADGSEVPIRDIRPGDRVKTFDNGRLATSIVRNHASVGHDDVYRLTLRSGKTVTANARHPFLVSDNGALKWIRVRNLTTGLTIVTSRDNAVSGKAKRANGKVANGRQSVAATAQLTTLKSERSTDISRPLTIQILTEKHASSIGTELPLMSTTQCSRLSAASVQFADNLRTRQTRGNIKPADCALITATKLARFALCSAMIATSRRDMLSQAILPGGWQDTSELMSDPIVAIEYDGRAEVFDIEVEGTGNFFAGGMVSHNTRWHEDDLIGRILKHALEDSEQPMRVREIRLPALAEPTPEQPDPLGRQTDEALWPERYTTAALKAKRALMDGYWFNAMFQQRLTSHGFNEWPGEYFYGIMAQDDEWPDRFTMSATALDPSKGRDAKKGDYSGIVTAGYSKGYIWLDCDLERRPVPKMMRDLVDWNNQRRPTVTGIEAVAFQELLGTDYVQAQIEAGGYRDDPELIYNNVSKNLRIGRLGTWLRLHMLKIRNTPGGRMLLQQMKEFPNGKYDDGPDAAEMAIRLLLTLSEALADIYQQASPMYTERIIT